MDYYILALVVVASLAVVGWLGFLHESRALAKQRWLRSLDAYASRELERGITPRGPALRSNGWGEASTLNHPRLPARGSL